MTPADLKAIRERYNLNRTEFARLLGDSANYLMRIERGEEPISQRFEKIVRFTFPEKKNTKPSKSD